MTLEKVALVSKNCEFETLVLCCSVSPIKMAVWKISEAILYKSLQNFSQAAVSKVAAQLRLRQLSSRFSNAILWRCIFFPHFSHICAFAASTLSSLTHGFQYFGPASSISVVFGGCSPTHSEGTLFRGASYNSELILLLIWWQHTVYVRAFW